MRVCIIEPYRSRGVSYLSAETASRLRTMGVGVDLICPAVSSNQFTAHPSWMLGVGLPSKIGCMRNIGLLEVVYGFMSTLKLLGVTRKREYDALIFNGASVSALIYLIFGRALVNRRVVYQNAGPTPNYIPDSLTRKLATLAQAIIYRLASGIVFRGARKFANDMIKVFSINPEKVLVTPPPIYEEMTHISLDESFKKEIGLEGHAVVLLVSDVSPRKNQLSFIQAAPAILEKHPGVMFLLVGSIEDVQYYNRIIQYAAERDIRRNLVIVSRQLSLKELVRYYSVSDIFVLLSKAEGLSGALVWAMVQGKAIVASSISENEECARTGAEMLFVQPEDVTGVAAAVNKLLDDPVLRRSLGNNSRTTALDYFDSTKVTQSLLHFLEVIGPARHGQRRAHLQVRSSTIAK
jgi:glycosyltransferase involved in cell wall biosynthesis